MKNTIKLFGILLIVFGVFVLVGSVSASAAEELQPAGLVTYNEDVTVNGTMRANSAYIGSTEAGVGGVTFFNGTMINGSLDEEGNGIPLTMGDDVRIDGEIWRIEKGGDYPLKISDHMAPTLDNLNDMGIEGLAWRNMYYADTLHGGSADLSGDLEVDGVVTFGDTMAVAEVATFGGGSGNSGVTIHANGEMNVDGDLNVHGNVVQDLDNNGIMKALIRVESDGTCPQQWTYNGSVVTCPRTGTTGVYDINFAFDINDKYFQLTTYTDILTPTEHVIASGYYSTNRQLKVSILDVAGHIPRWKEFMVAIY